MASLSLQLHVSSNLLIHMLRCNSWNTCSVTSFSSLKSGNYSPSVHCKWTSLFHPKAKKGYLADQNKSLLPPWFSVCSVNSRDKQTIITPVLCLSGIRNWSWHGHWSSKTRSRHLLRPKSSSWWLHGSAHIMIAWYSRNQRTKRPRDHLNTWSMTVSHKIQLNTEKPPPR